MCCGVRSLGETAQGRFQVLEDQVKYKLLEAALESYFDHEAAEYVERKRHLDIVSQELAERGQVIENKRRRSLVASGRPLQLVQISTSSAPPAQVPDVVFQNAVTAELVNLRLEINAKLGVLPNQLPPFVTITGFSMSFLQRTVQSPANEFGQTRWRNDKKEGVIVTNQDGKEFHLAVQLSERSLLPDAEESLFANRTLLPNYLRLLVQNNGHKLSPERLVDLMQAVSKWVYGSRCEPELISLVGLYDFHGSPIMLKVGDHYPNLFAFLQGKFTTDSSFSVDRVQLAQPPLNIYAFTLSKLPTCLEEVNLEWVSTVMLSIQRFFSAFFGNPVDCPQDLQWPTIFEVLFSLLRSPLGRVLAPSYLLDKLSRLFQFVLSTIGKPLFICSVHTSIIDIFAFRQLLVDELSKIKIDEYDFSLWKRNDLARRAFLCYGSTKVSDPLLLPKLTNSSGQLCAKSLLETIRADIGNFQCNDAFSCTRRHLTVNQIIEEKPSIVQLLPKLRYGWKSSIHMDESIALLKSFNG